MTYRKPYGPRDAFCPICGAEPSNQCREVLWGRASHIVVRESHKARGVLPRNDGDVYVIVRLPDGRHVGKGTT